MGVYLPTAALGNGRTLCTLGTSGEVMTFFYPNIDFAQNVRQLLSALYVGDPGQGRFLWTFDDEFIPAQAYTPQAGVLVTTLRLPTEGVCLSLTDFCPPDEPALVRRVRIEAEDDRPFVGRFLKYFELRINEVTGKQSVRYMHPEGIALQYCRDIAVAIGGARPSVWRCGKSIDEGPRSAKSDLYDGHLNGQPEDIGQVDLALGWDVHAEPGKPCELDIIIAASADRERAVHRVQALAQAGGEALEDDTRAEDRDWLQRHFRPEVHRRFQNAYDRALLSLRMLQDSRTSAVVAAPEFDPAYELCGGYGYCWPRDATEAMEALALAGDPHGMQRLCEWYMKAQLPSGQWGQRYWSSALMASSWSLREDFMQVDQTAAALIAICGDSLLRPVEGGFRILETRWPKIRKGAESLAGMVSENGWHKYACDLWETFCGTFVYTNAAIYAALKQCARVARFIEQHAAADRWDDICERMKRATVALHNGEHFPRGLLDCGEPDMIVDSSTLGVSEPFRMISAQEPEERVLIETNLDVIEQRLGYRLEDGGVGIRRHEADGYLGGVIGCVNTLWFALVNLQVAGSYMGEDDARAAELREKAQRYIDFCLAHATPTGLLPELIGTGPDYPYWAAPHSWASGLMVKCVLQLHELTTRPQQPPAAPPASNAEPTDDLAQTGDARSVSADG